MIPIRIMSYLICKIYLNFRIYLKYFEKMSIFKEFKNLAIQIALV